MLAGGADSINRLKGPMWDCAHTSGAKNRPSRKPLRGGALCGRGTEIERAIEEEAKKKRHVRRRELHSIPKIIKTACHRCPKPVDACAKQSGNDRCTMDVHKRNPNPDLPWPSPVRPRSRRVLPSLVDEQGNEHGSLARCCGARSATVRLAVVRGGRRHVLDVCETSTMRS